MEATKWNGLSGNQLKILALIAMTCDHVGLQLLPQYGFLRIIGRLAFPIFAYMIAEGCYYTKNRKKYLLTILLFAFLCQMVYFLAMGSLYQRILVTFSLSIVLIYAFDYAKNRQSIVAWFVFFVAFWAVFFLSEILPQILSGTDYVIDYRIWGILLPVFLYIGSSKKAKLVLASFALIALAYVSGGIQWYGLCALPFLALYNGKRGKWKMKYLFYIYYPLHLAVIYGISMII